MGMGRTCQKLERYTFRRTRSLFLVLLCFFLLWFVPLVQAQGADRSDPSSEGAFHISQWNGDAWEELYHPPFQVTYSTKAFDFNVIDGEVSLRIVQTGLPFADIDQAKLVACGRELHPEYARHTDNSESVLEDILAIDHDVALAHEQEIEISWKIPDPCEQVTLFLHANQYGHTGPLHFPITGYAGYEMGSNIGSIVVDGSIHETDGIATLYSPFWKPSTGHPDGTTYIYVCDDSENLYFSLDVTADNTQDHGEDWAEITILTSEGTEHVFRIDDFDDTWGKTAFGRTSRVRYKHQTCEFRIPKAIVGNEDIDFRLRYYGTTGVALLLTKAFTDDPVPPGGTVTLEFTITNMDQTDAVTSIEFTDDLNAALSGLVVSSVDFNDTGGSVSPPGLGLLSLTGGSVGLGASATLRVTLSVPGAASPGTYTNTTSQITGTRGGSPITGNPATDGLIISTAADLSVTKTDGVTQATPGGSLTYTIVVSNAGPSDDPAVNLSDTFSAPLTATYTSVAAGGATGNTAAGAGDLSETLSMPAGSSVTYTVTCSISAGATGTLSNTATVTASVTDPDPGNDTFTDGDTVLSPRADLSVTKTDGLTQAAPGGSLTYTIVVSNAGPSDDPAVNLSDTFPVDLAGTYTSVAAGGASGNTAAGAGDLAETLSMPAGSSVTYTVTCSIDAGATGTLSNTATVTASVTDPVLGDNSATDGDTVLSTKPSNVAPNTLLLLDEEESGTRRR
ncbi:MAG: hypothetical protein SWE60_01795 [Thermodesulfobacteriota bacterium]|nr:hypothetical protein [Thermodesulfobacteriota bacterium]